MSRTIVKPVYHRSASDSSMTSILGISALMGKAMRSTILVSDPKASYVAHREEIDDAIARVLASGRYILGPEVSAFEQELAQDLGVANAIGVASGTDAIHLALRAIGVGPNDRVITVSHTAVATVAAIELTGAKPLFVDVDDATFTMSPSSLEETITRAKRSSGDQIKAIIPVHYHLLPLRCVAPSSDTQLSKKQRPGPFFGTFF